MIEVNYERRGAGSPLVLLHGLGHRWQAWRPVLDRLAEYHDVIALDLPGFGRSAPLPVDAVHDLESSMTILGAVFAQLGVRGAHVAGNSVGGVLAVEAATRGMVASATALSPAGFWGAADRMRARTALRLIRAGARAPAWVHNLVMGNDRLRLATLRLLYAHPERIDRLDAEGDRAALRSASAFLPTLRAGRRFAWDELLAPTVPVTVAWGELDRVMPLRQARRAAALLPGAHHVTLPGCGHVPMIDDPALVARIILDTCARAAVPDAGRGPAAADPAECPSPLEDRAAG